MYILHLGTILTDKTCHFNMDDTSIAKLNVKDLYYSNSKSVTSISSRIEGQVCHQTIDEKCYSYAEFLKYLFLVIDIKIDQ